MGVKYEKQKLYSGVCRVTFFVFRAPFYTFCILQHFAPGSAFVWKLKGFRGLFFCGINKTRNSPEMRKVYSECFIFCGVFCENIREIPAKCEIRKVYNQPNELQLNETWITRFLFLEYFDRSRIVFDNRPFSYKNLSLALQKRNAETQILL